MKELSASLSGIVTVYKEEGMTSQTVVNKVKRIFGVAKAGHTGTLDPLATGVLPVLIGRAVKASEYMLTSDKHYLATLKLGITTDTEDVTGTVLTECRDIPSEEQVRQTISRFVGQIMQTPPMYSALKVGGRKLCDIARQGEIIEREARPITVFSIDVNKLSIDEYTLEVRCSKGTYIRTLCADIGSALGCGGVMKTLCRLSAAGIGLDRAKTLSELAEMTDEQREEFLLKPEFIFRDLRSVTLSPFFSRLALSGLEIYLKKIGFEAEEGERVALFNENGFFALGEVRAFEGGLAIKPIKQLG